MCSSPSQAVFSSYFGKKDRTGKFGEQRFLEQDQYHTHVIQRVQSKLRAITRKFIAAWNLNLSDLGWELPPSSFWSIWQCWGSEGFTFLILPSSSTLFLITSTWLKTQWTHHTRLELVQASLEQGILSSQPQLCSWPGVVLSHCSRQNLKKPVQACRACSNEISGDPRCARSPPGSIVWHQLSQQGTEPVLVLTEECSWSSRWDHCKTAHVSRAVGFLGRILHESTPT